ncbi:MAG: hypothetical protein ACLSE6_01835 [Alphaproteobacteria bacterium]
MCCAVLRKKALKTAVHGLTSICPASLPLSAESKRKCAAIWNSVTIWK